MRSLKGIALLLFSIFAAIIGVEGNIYFLIGGIVFALIGLLLVLTDRTK